MNKNELLKKLNDLEQHLTKLYNIEDKSVAFYNREVYETRQEIYNIKQLLKEEYQYETI